jgi:hypothetical protein
MVLTMMLSGGMGSRDVKAAAPLVGSDRERPWAGRRMRASCSPSASSWDRPMGIAMVNVLS